MKKRIIALLCLLVMAISLVATGCQGKVVAYKRGTPLPVNKINFRGLEEDEFYISGYIGPQDFYAAVGYSLPSLITDESYAELAEAGINYIIEQRMDVDGEEAQRAMELAAKYDINYFIKVNSVLKTEVTKPEDAYIAPKEDVKAKMEELLQNPGFGGVYYRDEPTSNLFPMLDQAVDVLYEVREELGETDLNCMINAFPGVGWSQLSAGTDPEMNWTKYITAICEMGIDYLSWDAYPFTNVPGEVQASWLNTLGTLNEFGDRYNLPLVGNIQCGGGSAMFSTSHRVVNEAEMHWNVGTMLAYGFKGLVYYTLVTPPEAALLGEEYVNTDSILNKYGSKTPFWHYAKNINTQVQAMAPVLLNAAQEGVMLNNNDSPNVYTGNDILESYRCFKGWSGDSALIGCFDYEGTVALVVVNNSLDNHHAVVTLEFDNNYEYEVTQRAQKDKISGKEFSLHLEAGEFALVVVQ